MTTLYRPVLIESAEQAEKMPIGTSVKRAVWHHSGHQEHYAGVKVGTNTWFTTSPTADLQDALSRHMVGWTALVPVEAEEETTVPFQAPVGVRHVGFGSRAFDTPHTRLVTPWKRAGSPSQSSDVW